VARQAFNGQGQGGWLDTQGFSSCLIQHTSHFPLASCFPLATALGKLRFLGGLLFSKPVAACPTHTAGCLPTATPSRCAWVSSVCCLYALQARHTHGLLGCTACSGVQSTAATARHYGTCKGIILTRADKPAACSFWRELDLTGCSAPIARVEETRKRHPPTNPFLI
jgi:hypothetical protein